VSEGPIEAYLADLHREVSGLSGGEPAGHTPALALAPANAFGIAIATLDGKVYEVGDTRSPFTLQSIAKPLMHALALEDVGRETVLRHVGVEPTGEASSAIGLDENRPFNPMVNAGALAITALVQGADYPTRRARVLAMLEGFAGHTLMIDEAAFRAERDAGERNKAIAALMRQAEMLEGDTGEILDLYFSQCAVQVDCADLAMMAATLANGGVNPLTEERAMRGEFATDVLTVMNSCGMYNYAGQWSYEVGAPATASVAGAIIAVVPGQVGIAAYAPRLDGRGNSIRGLEACKRIARDFDLHVFRHQPNSAAVLRGEAFGAAVRSRRKRTLAESEILDRQGGRICILEAQGALFFGSAERLDRRIGERLEDCDHVVVDLHRVTEADEAAQDLLVKRAVGARAGGLLFAHLPPGGALNGLQAGFVQAGLTLHADRDSALEAFENNLLSQRSAVGAGAASLTLSQTDIFQGLSADDMAALEALAHQQVFETGEVMLREGDQGRTFFVITEGSASVSLRLGLGGRSLRVATMGPGSTVGELALLDGGPRSADVLADQRTVCHAFSIDALKDLGKTRPQMLVQIFANLSRDLAERLRGANREIRTLEA